MDATSVGRASAERACAPATARLCKPRLFLQKDLRMRPKEDEIPRTESGRRKGVTLVPTRAANAWHFVAFNVARHRSTQHHLDMGADAFKLSRLRANRGKVFCL